MGDQSKTLVYLDEGGDLGWKFDAPYRNGGSSRYLTICSVFCSPETKHLPKRLVRGLYKKFGWSPTSEKKWSDMTLAQRVEFSRRAFSLHQKHPSAISFHSIVVKKANVQEHIRKDSNKLYNYMIGLSLLNAMKGFDEVEFIPDARSVKVKSGNSLHDYLQTKLWFDKGAKTKLSTCPMDSDQCVNIQFADMLSGAVQGYFEDQKHQPYNCLRHILRLKTLYF